MTDEVKQRKIEHVSVALGQDVSAPQRASWSDVQFVHQALPEVDLDEIDTSTHFLGRTLRYPIFISSLTLYSVQGQHLRESAGRVVPLASVLRAMAK